MNQKENNKILRRNYIMNKKFILSTVTAAAILFSGAAFNKAEAAQVSTNQVTYKVTTQADAQKLIQQYLKK